MNVDDYRQKLRTLPDWDSFLLEESRLPGPRANLELARVAAEEGDAALFRRYLSIPLAEAPANSPQEFLVFCGLLGLGQLLTRGDRVVLETLRALASDPRWRIREAVATALQAWGEVDMDGLLQEMAVWSRGNYLEQRAAVAALCEPKLLHRPEQVERVLRIVNNLTTTISQAEDRKSEAFKALRKALGYCWSVAVVAFPAAGKPMMEHWLSSLDQDIQWVMRENLKKDRLARMDQEWVAGCASRLGR
ncbi:MAG: hypothetical protein L0332_29350 [Chloroflexi bacterium]|nr:hypothetical protein [Chloroflexota bacterium]MCI0578937.1 hypothetical protein [Chloroflexota bacterium]MCI0646874.1 hypothetical protein [Chloroflexota bacterium]MCI0730808.1 hypothetical protein [Chloroflexota bacterium]